MKIESLTQEQKDRFQEFIDKWTKIGLSCEPAKRKEAEFGIKTAYKIAGKNPPKKIVWCGSPLSQGLTRAIIFRLKDSEIKVGKKLKASVRDSVRDSVYGQQEASWLAFYEYFKEICGLDSQTQKLSGIWQISKNAGWWLPHENLCWISERPNILHRDTQGRLHKDGDFALRYPDGWGIYAWHGVRLPRQYGSIRSERWQSEWLLKETNAELRRALIQGIGYSRLCKELQAESLDSWREYELLKLGKTIDVEPVVMIKMTCPSTGLIHAHRVPQEIKTAREAISWVNQEIDPEEFAIER